jgi:hypothetical protein
MPRIAGHFLCTAVYTGCSGSDLPVFSDKRKGFCCLSLAFI